VGDVVGRSEELEEGAQPGRSFSVLPDQKQDRSSITTVVQVTLARRRLLGGRGLALPVNSGSLIAQSSSSDQALGGRTWSVSTIFLVDTGDSPTYATGRELGSLNQAIALMGLPSSRQRVEIRYKPNKEH
jgi:hypothetical protein